MNLVVDCSYIISSIFKEVAEVEYELYKVYVPTIFYMEYNSVLLKVLRRKEINEVGYREYIDKIGSLPLNVDNFSSTYEGLCFISKLSKKHNLFSYEASYLELALRVNAKFATFDKCLKDACILNQIEVIT